MRQITLLLIVLGVAIVGLIVFWLSRLPGGVSVDMFGWQAQLSAAVAILAVIVLGGVMAFVWSVLAGVVSLPGKLGQRSVARRARKANQALADGLLAAEAGDAAAAKRFAKRAARHADDQRLKLLLDARAAEAENDWIGAERAWGQLTRLPGGQLAGLRGAAGAAMERGDRATAEVNAREALGLAHGAEWPFSSLFNLQTAKGDWEGALQTLDVGERSGRIKGDMVRRRRAVLKAAFAAGLPRARRLEAQKALAEAIKAAPGFPPAAWHGARHLISDGKTKAAESVLELAWKARPHPALALLARRAGGANEAPRETEARLERLVGAYPDHRESRILAAEIKMDRGRWEGAVRDLAGLVEERPTARLCLLLERALKGFGDPEEAGRWARTAVSAAREADWSDIDPKGAAFDYSKADWGRLVFAFGDAAQLVHPRHEAFGRELEPGKPPAALPAPGAATLTSASVRPPGAPPLDFAPNEET